MSVVRMLGWETVSRYDKRCSGGLDLCFLGNNFSVSLVQKSQRGNPWVVSGRQMSFV